MKAVLLKNYGGVDQLDYTDAADPKPAAGEVLVKLIATSINPIDYKVRRGDMKERMPLEFPAILGRDLAGEVVGLGEGVTSLKVGALVMGLTNHTFAELVACKADILTLIPEGLDPVDAGALPLILLTGTQLIEKGVAPESGQRVLITGALGSVGRTAVHVAKEHGAYVIVAVRAREQAEAEKLGADEVIALDDEQALQALKPLDVIADTVGPPVIDRLITCLKKNGVLATVVGKPAAADGKDVQVHPVFAQPDPARLAQVVKDVVNGNLTIPIGKRLKLADIRQAQEMTEKGGAGKVLLTP